MTSSRRPDPACLGRSVGDDNNGKIGKNSKNKREVQHAPISGNKVRKEPRQDATTLQQSTASSW
ncbi:hypothetical protein E4U21_003614 [Claviceps maximensis]|nr:hypothetical protein E4U21_003614 [Claviceps maximensis]